MMGSKPPFRSGCLVPSPELQTECHDCIKLLNSFQLQGCSQDNGLYMGQKGAKYSWVFCVQIGSAYC